MSRGRIHESSKIPDDLFPILGKQLCLVIALTGLLYSISIITNQDPLPVTQTWHSCTNFRMLPSTTVNTNILEYNNTHFFGDHVVLEENQVIAMEFPMSESKLKEQNYITITATANLVSHLNSFEGNLPINILINNRTLVTHSTMLDGHYNGQTATFAIPADFLTVGTNVVIIRVAPDPNAHSYLWLYNVAVGNSTVQNSQCKLPSRSLKERFLPLIHRAFLSLENLLGFTHYTGIRENTWHY